MEKGGQAHQHSGRDLSSVQRWLESGDFGRRGGDGVAAGPPVRWASVDMDKIPIAENKEGKEGPEGDDTRITSGKRNPVHRRSLERLRGVLATADRDAEVLELVEDCPSDAEWEVLEAHFRNVRWLLVETGFDETWLDRKFPLSWPLELLVVSSASGDPVTTPAILEGRIPHVVLLLTCNLRFEGPGNDELDACKDLENETEAQLNEDRDGQGKPNVAITCRPARASKWLHNKYGDGVRRLGPRPEEHPVSRLKTLEILENDAIDTFQRLALSHSHLIMGLERLNLRSTHGADFRLTPETIFPLLFSVMSSLKHLELSLSYPFADNAILHNLYRSLPPNLETLSFRGPPSIAGSGRFDEWIAAFGSRRFLPSLKRLSFSLDAGVDVGADDLASASVAVDKLLSGAAAKGVAIEEFRDPWYDVSLFRRYDKRPEEAEGSMIEPDGAS